MNKSTFGKLFTVTTWGESHGKALGAVVDGCPAGLELDESHIQKYLNRRKPGQSRYTTARKEGDQVEILSGVFEGKTTGTPISLMVRNMDQRSGITEILLTLTVRDMQILPLIPNMDSGITGAAGVPPEEKPLEEWRREQLP